MTSLLRLLLCMTTLLPVSVGQEAAQNASVHHEENADAQKGLGAGDSHVRIVRLSNARGQVGLDRGRGRGVEVAMRNMPVVEGLKLLTADGYAEVEFDDTSRLRLTPSTSVRFPRLVLRSTGAQSSAIRLDVGTIYVNLQDTKNNDFTLIVGSRKITVNRSTHLRLSFFDSAAELAVFSGSAVVQSNAAPVVVAKKQTLVMDALGSGPGQLENNLKEGTYDDWEENVMKYHEHHPRRAAGGRWDYF